MTALPPSTPGKEHPSEVSTKLRFYAVASATVTLGVYLLTLAPDLSWANAATDGGELITASVTMGLAHPPGYPTYVLLGKLFGLLPLGTMAFRYNLLSAVSMACAVGLLVLAIGAFHYPRVRPSVAAAAALLFAFTPLAWSQAIVAEVYTLNLLFVAAFLLVWSRRGASGWSGFWLGLAITTHLSSLLMLPALFFKNRYRWPRTASGIAAGLTPLLLLPWLAIGQSPVVWGRPIDLTGWWWLASGRLYTANIQPAIDVDRLFTLLQAIALGPAALILSGRAVRPLLPAKITRLAAANSRPTPMVLLGTAFLYLVFALTYKTPDAAVLLLPALMMTVLLTAGCLERLGSAAFLLPVALAIIAYPAMDLSHKQGPRPLAERLMHAAPENALLLASGDRTIFTLWYFHFVEGLRPDLTLVDANLFAFDWYRERLRQLNPAISVPLEDDLIAFQRDNESNRPFCVVSLVSPPGELPGGAQVLSRASQGPPYLTCSEGSRLDP